MDIAGDEVIRTSAILVFLVISTIVVAPIPVPSLQTSAFRGTSITLTVQLRSQSGLPIENATVLFFHETQDIHLGTVTTNSTGHASFIWAIPPFHELGSVQLNATFPGDPERYLLPSMVPIPLTVFAQLQNHINITDANGVPVNSEVQIGQKLLFHTQITDNNMTPMEGIPVQLILDPDIILAEKNTPQNGSILLSCTLNQTLSSVAIFRIKSLSQGYHNGTESVVQLFFRNATTSFAGVPSFWHPSNGYTLRGKLITQTNKGISNASIELLSDSGQSLSFSRTENDGKFSFDLYELVEALHNSDYLILWYNGTLGLRAAQAIIGIITSPPYNPFTQSIEPTPSTTWISVLHQISLVTISFLAIGSSILTLRMKRSTKRIVSH
jgi:hypothetical protein